MAGTKDARGRDVLNNCMRLENVADVLDMCQEELQKLETHRVAASVARKLDTLATHPPTHPPHVPSRTLSYTRAHVGAGA